MNIKSRSIIGALVASAFLGTASSAIAAPVFKIDLAAITGGAPAVFTGDFFSGTSTEMLTTVGNTHSGSGWMQISGLSLNALGQVPFGTNIFSPFNLYVTFQLQDHLVSGAMNAPGSTYQLDVLNFQLFSDKDKNTVLTNASVDVLGNASGATVSGNLADDKLLGFGSLIFGTAGLSALGGANLNSVNTFALCNGAGTAAVGAQTIAAGACADDTGKKFLFDPEPFYELAFTEFNNTAQGFAIGNGGELVINSASGGVDFNRIPEPGTLALAGLGLIGLGFGAKRRKAS